MNAPLYGQLSLEKLYSDVSTMVEDKDPTFLDFLEEHIDFENLIPENFYNAFYKTFGRNRAYSLESFIRFFVLKLFIGVKEDKTMLSVVSGSKDYMRFCRFYGQVPGPDKITRFKQDFGPYIAEMFNHLVEVTEPICKELDAIKSNQLIFDTTGIEVWVKENNPKFFNSKLKMAKAFSKSNADYDPYRAVYNFLPEKADYCPEATQQYINGHFCYAVKAGIITNALGIPRHIQVFDNEFKKNHPEAVSCKSDNPDIDKTISDSKALIPVLSDFFDLHPGFSPKTFMGDASFDSYDNYAALIKKFGFSQVCIPINSRNTKSSGKRVGAVDFDANGTPLCPLNHVPFICLGKSKGRNRSERIKYVCPKSKAINHSRVCTCETPCTDSSYGRCVHIYPDKDLRMYPGIRRGTEQWKDIYDNRITIERTINLMKDTFGLSSRRSQNTTTLKSDVYLVGIVQLIAVILAKAIQKPGLFKSVRKLLNA